MIDFPDIVVPEQRAHKISDYSKMMYQNDQTLKQDVSPCKFWLMFKFTDKLDILMIVVGACCSIGCGVLIVQSILLFYNLIVSRLRYSNLLWIVQPILSAILLGVCWLKGVMWTISSERRIIRIRRSLFQSILTQQVGWHQKFKISNISQKLHLQVQKVHQGIGVHFDNLIQSITICIYFIVISFSRAWKLTLVMIFPVFFYFLSDILKSMFKKKINEQEKKSKSKLDEQINEVFENMRTIKMYDGEDYQIKRFELRLKKIHEQIKINQMTNKIYDEIKLFFALLTFSIGILYGNQLVMDQTLNEISKSGYSSLDIQTVLLAIFGVTFTLKKGKQSLAFFNLSRCSMKNILQIINRQPRVKEGTQQAPRNIQFIQFKQVLFHYQRPLFQKLSLKIPKGVTALVGNKESGKTTLFYLMLRLLNVFEGSILLCNKSGMHDLKTIKFNSLRSRVAYVGQHSVIYGKSVRQILGAENLPQEHIIQLLKRTTAWKFVEKFGLDRENVVFSNNEKQILSITQALLKKPEILLLDNSMSIFDIKTQHDILDSIIEEKIGFVIIVNKQRLPLTKVDWVIKLNEGKVTASGGPQNQVLTNKIISDSQLLQKKLYAQKKQIAQSDIKIIEQNSQSLDVIKLKPSQEYKKQEGIQNKNKNIQKQFRFRYILKLILLNKRIHCFCVLGGISSLIVGGLYLAFPYSLYNSLVMLNAFRYQTSLLRLIGYKEQAKVISISIFLISLFYLLLKFLKRMAQTYLTQALGNFLKLSSFQKLIKKRLGFVQGYGKKNLAKVLTFHCENLKQLGQYYPNIIEKLSTILAGLIMSLIFNWQITLISIIFFLLIGLFLKLQACLTSSRKKSYQQAEWKSREYLVESLKNIKIMKSLLLEHKINQEYSQSVNTIKLAIKYGNLGGVVQGLKQALGFLLFQLFLFICVLLFYDTVNTDKSLWTAIFIIVFTGIQIWESVRKLSIVSLKQSICRYFEIMNNDEDKPISNPQQSNNGILDVTSDNDRKIYGNIQFKNVLLKQGDTLRPFSQGLSFRINRGQRVVIFGESRQQMEAITNILFRIQDPSSGEIYIDGQNIKKYPLSILRKQLAIVTQGSVLFNRSVYENIKYNSQASFQDVLQSTKIANALDFILQGDFAQQDEEQPLNNDEIINQIEEIHTEVQIGENIKQTSSIKINSFNKKIGIGGSYLSKSERRKLCLAKALVRKPSVIFLDGGDSKMKKQDRKMLYNQLERIKGITQIIFTNDFEILQNCDLIIAMGKGEVIQQGNYKQLMRKRGYFYNIINRLKQQGKQQLLRR